MSRSKTAEEALCIGKARLFACGKENAAMEATWLLMEASGMSRLMLLTEGEKILTDDAWEKYDAFLGEREKNRPLQYILGSCEFMGLPFAVGEGVLIPRADTEVLVEAALEAAKKEDFHFAADICTGSGCIPIALAKNGIAVTYGTDISEDALAFARKNGKENGVDTIFLQGDLFGPLPENMRGKFDLLTANPPYITEEEMKTLMAEVRDYEPSLALFGGRDGLDFYRRIAKESRIWLKAGGMLFLEIGQAQGKEVCDLLRAHGFAEIRTLRDLAGLDRVVCGRKLAQHEGENDVC